jgi:hypothetical protein
MNAPSPGQRAVADLEIDDVFLIGADCQVDPQFNQTELFENVVFQHRVGLGPTIYGQSRVPLESSDPELHIVRFVVTGEVRILRRNAKHDSEEVVESDVLATIKLEYAADYRCSRSLIDDQGAIKAFGRNAVFHVWPYLREGIHDCAARMRLPRITVPMLKPAGSNAAGQVEGQLADAKD